MNKIYTKNQKKSYLNHALKKLRYYLHINHSTPYLLNKKKAASMLSKIIKQPIVGGIDNWIFDLYINKKTSVFDIIKPSSKRKKKENQDFYESSEWQSLRKKVFKEYGKICMKCKCTNKEMHIDHIKPRSIYPELELDFNNLQVLCKQCNIVKSNLNCNDYRPINIATN
jgi:hypothetical protein